MRHPCVEVYFEVETGGLDIRVWMKTDDQIIDGDVGTKFHLAAEHLRIAILTAGRCMSRPDMVAFLEREQDVSAFQVTYRSDNARMAIIVYEEWP